MAEQQNIAQIAAVEAKIAAVETQLQGAEGDRELTLALLQHLAKPEERLTKLEEQKLVLMKQQYAGATGWARYHQAKPGQMH